MEVIPIDRQNSISFTIRGLSNLLRRKMMEVAPPPEDRHGTTETEGQIMGFLCDHPDRALYQRDVEEACLLYTSPVRRPRPGAAGSAG